MAHNVQPQVRRKMEPASQLNDNYVLTEWHKCAQLRNIEAKARTKHNSLHKGFKKKKTLT